MRNPILALALFVTFQTLAAPELAGFGELKRTNLVTALNAVKVGTYANTKAQAAAVISDVYSLASEWGNRRIIVREGAKMLAADTNVSNAYLVAYCTNNAGVPWGRTIAADAATYGGRKALAKNLAALVMADTNASSQLIAYAGNALDTSRNHDTATGTDTYKKVPLAVINNHADAFRAALANPAFAVHNRWEAESAWKFILWVQRDCGTDTNKLADFIALLRTVYSNTERNQQTPQFLGKVAFLIQSIRAMGISANETTGSENILVARMNDAIAAARLESWGASDLPPPPNDTILAEHFTGHISNSNAVSIWKSQQK